MTVRFSEAERCVDEIIATVGRTLIVGTPLGLGKANLLLNALYRRAVADPSLSLTIFTALTLEVPKPQSDLERRFLAPLIKRWFDGYPELDYAVARSQDALPANVTVHEFFMSPGKFLRNVTAQQDYISTNYTHVARDMLSRGVNVVVQMVSPGRGAQDGRVSLSCNPDVTLELVPKMRAAGRAVIAVGEVNDALPFMYGDADVEAAFFDALFTPQAPYTLFGAPKSSVSVTDHMIGLQASALVRDDGTLQVGIGSLGDAVANALGVRQTDNATYRELIDQTSSAQSREVQSRLGALEPFDRGLYGATEMFVDGFLHLFRLGVLSRRVYDDVHVQALLNQARIGEAIDANTLDELERGGAFTYPLTATAARYLQNIGVINRAAELAGHELRCAEQALALPADRESARDFIRHHALGDRLRDPAVLHGGFYLGDQAFYEALRALTDDERQLLKMTSVDRINQLYRGERLDRLQRRNARFINTCLMVTLNGAVVSDGLDDARVISGVGGQYNFVAMAHALDESRSVIKLRSTYAARGGLRSNIVFSYGHTTIPRHLRDVVVTEYGTADLRGRSDRECAEQLINLADSRFQDALVAKAVAAGKLPPGYRVDDAYRQNRPERLAAIARRYRHSVFQPFPLGTDLSEDDIRLGGALKRLAAIGASRSATVRALWRSRGQVATPQDGALLARVGLDKPRGLKDKLLQRLLLVALRSSDDNG